MSITTKYKFKVSLDQFGNKVAEDWYDYDEIILINEFEQVCLKLPKKEHYMMIELGANQAYYSLLFKSILGRDKTTSIMVEPYEPYVYRAKHEFDLNGFDGIYVDKGIGERCQIHGHSFNKLTTSIDELINQYNIKNLDVLQCDIDGAEFLMLEGAHNSLQNKIIDYIFVATHYGVDKHEEFKNKMNQYEYKLIYDEPKKLIGGDSLLIYKRII